MTHYPLRKMLDLAQASRRLQEESSAANVETFEALFTQMRLFEQLAESWQAESEFDALPESRSLREARINGPNVLSVGGSIVFEMEAIGLTISIYRENIPGSLKLHGDVSSEDLAGTAVMLYQANTLIDADVVDRNGEFILTALEPGNSQIELRTNDHRQINLTAVELAP